MKNTTTIQFQKTHHLSEVRDEAEMPTPKVEFVAVLEDTDDEIEVIPYVKPPPVVIEIVESDPESTNASDEKKKKRKNKKNKKSKREKEREGSTDDASHIADPSLSLNANSHVDSTPTSNAYDNEVSTGQNVEPEATSSGYSSSSGNVAVARNSSIYDFVDETEEILPNTSIGRQVLSGSYLEANDYTQSINREGTSVVAEAVMVGTTAQNQNDKDPKDKQSRSKEKKVRGEGKPRTRKISATQRTNEEIVNFLTTLGIQMEASAFESPPAKRRRQPAKRTKSGATDSVATDSDSAIANGDDTINNDVHNVEEQQLQPQSNISEAENIVQGAFVAVTQESNKAAKNSPRKGKRQRTAIVGDISDFEVSFSKGELNSINTNFQSNVVFTTADNEEDRPEDSSIVRSSINNYDAIIDAVARSGVVQAEPRNLEESSTKTHQPKISITSEVLTNDICSNVNEDISPLARNQTDVEQPSGILLEGTPTTSELQQESVTPSTSRDEDIRTTKTLDKPLIIRDEQFNSDTSGIGGAETDKNSNTTKRKNSSRDSFTIPTNDSQGECSSSSSVSKKNSHGQQETIQPTTKRQKSDCDVVTLNISNTHTPATVSNATAGCSATQEFQQEHIPTIQELPQGQVTCTDIVPYFPTTWTSHMKDFYGSSQNEDFELDEALEQLSDAPGKWRAVRDLMPPPKNKNRYVRCDRCKQMGHFAKQCTEKYKPPCCHMCGSEGHTSDHHSRRPCNEAKCLNCGRNQVQYSQRCSSCLLRREPRKCEICNVIGHDKTICPDNWRPYHTITSVEEYEKVKPNVDNHSRRSSNYYKTSPDYKRKSAMFCSNCGKRGHSYYDCYQSRFNPYHRNKPFVIRNVPVPPVVNFLGSNTNVIPLSYDARTGRTVVLNKEPNAPPEIAVETIQVKITNELAVASRAETHDTLNQNVSAAAVVTDENKESEAISGDTIVTAAGKTNESTETTSKAINNETSDCLKKDSIPVVCGQHEKCTNSPKTNDECRQTILQKQSYKTLQKAREDGLLKIIEAKHDVQISLIDDNNRFHICGENVGDAQKDVCRILWSKEAMVFNDEKIRIINAKATKSNPDLSKTQEASSSPIKMELNAHPIPSDNKTQEVENLSAQTQTSSGWTSLKNSEKVQVLTIEDDEDDCCVIDELPVGTSKSTESARSSSAIASLAKAKHQESSKKDQKSVSPVTEKESRTPNKPSQQTVAGARSNVGDSFLRYESPLAGLTLGNPSRPPIIMETPMNEEVADKPILYIPLQGKSADNLQVLDSHKIGDSTASIQVFNKSPPNERLPSSSNKSNNASRTDKAKVSAIEIITLDDEEQTTNESDENEEKVTLLQSEWNLVMSHSVKIDNIINQIASRFGVDLVISKEVSSISISKGTKKNRKIAKDNIVFWLECQSSNSEFSILPSGYKLTGTPKPKKQNNKKLKRLGQGSTPVPVNPQIKRPLKLTDAHIVLTPKRKRSPKKKQKQWKKKNQINPNMIPIGSQHQSPTPSQNGTPDGNFGTPMHQWGPGFNKVNFGNTSLPMQSASPADVVARSPRSGFRNNSPQGGNGNTPRSRFNFQPRKPRYYHTS